MLSSLQELRALTGRSPRPAQAQRTPGSSLVSRCSEFPGLIPVSSMLRLKSQSPCRSNQECHGSVRILPDHGAPAALHRRPTTPGHALEGRFVTGLVIPYVDLWPEIPEGWV